MCRGVFDFSRCQVVFELEGVMSRPREWANKLLAICGRMACDESGATAIEYGLIIAGISIAILATVFAIGTELDNMFDMIGSRMQSRFSTM